MEPLDVLPRIVEKLIGLRLPEPRRGTANLEIQAWPSALPSTLEGLAQSEGDVVAEGHMGRRRVEDAEPLVLEIAAKLGLDLVVNDAAGPALPQATEASRIASCRNSLA